LTPDTVEESDDDETGRSTVIENGDGADSEERTGRREVGTSGAE
jgi:hypothetical protein